MQLKSPGHVVTFFLIIGGILIGGGGPSAPPPPGYAYGLALPIVFFFCFFVSMSLGIYYW